MHPGVLADPLQHLLVLGRTPKVPAYHACRLFQIVRINGYPTRFLGGSEGGENRARWGFRRGLRLGGVPREPTKQALEVLDGFCFPRWNVLSQAIGNWQCDQPLAISDAMRSEILKAPFLGIVIGLARLQALLRRIEEPVIHQDKLEASVG